MLGEIDSQQFAEWYAYERFNGPVDDRWRDEVQGSTVETLQGLMHLTGAVNTGKRKKNPVPEPKHIPRPWEKLKDDDEEDGED